MNYLFGKPTIMFKKLNDESAVWKKMPTPKQDTTSLETEEGEDIELRDEGGDILDSIFGTASYSLTFEILKKKGEALPIDDENGVVKGEYSFAVSSADVDDEPMAFLMPRCSVKVNRSYARGDGYRATYSVRAMKPSSGEIIQEIEPSDYEETFKDVSKDGE